MTALAAPVRSPSPRAHPLVTNATRVATALLAAASTIALGSAGVGVAVLAIGVLAPLVLLGTLALTRE